MVGAALDLTCQHWESKEGSASRSCAIYDREKMGSILTAFTVSIKVTASAHCATSRES